jgi:hypothetical protein
LIFNIAELSNVSCDLGNVSQILSSQLVDVEFIKIVHGICSFRYFQPFNRAQESGPSAASRRAGLTPSTFDKVGNHERSITRPLTQAEGKRTHFVNPAQS